MSIAGRELAREGGGDLRPSAARIEAPLLALLREQLGAPELAYAERPTLLGDGVTARAFSFRVGGVADAPKGPLVLRVFVHASDPAWGEQARVEAVVHNALAEQGAPVPRVIASGDETGRLGAPFLVMERARGRNLFGVLIPVLAIGIALGASVSWVPLIVLLLAYWICMSRLLVGVHAVPAEDIGARLERAGLPRARLSLEAALERLEQRIDQWQLDGLREVLAWLRSRCPAPPSRPTVCHGDFWLGNVMVSTRGWTLLDWTQACVTHPEYDLGWIRIQHFSRFPIEFSLDDRIYDAIFAVLRPFAWLLFGVHLLVYRLRRPVDRDRLGYFSVLHATRILAGVAELRKRTDANERSAELVAWGSPRTVSLLRRRIRAISGIDVRP